MTRHCCPKCEEHYILNDVLECDICGGRYKWIDKEIKLNKKDKGGITWENSKISYMM